MEGGIQMAGGADDRVAGERRIVRYDADGFRETDDSVAIEYALTIHVDDEEFVTMVCTPTDLEELIVGFLASEGIIRFPDEISSIAIDEARGFARVELVNPNAAGKATVSKRFIGSCCGKSRQFYFHNDMRTAKTSQSDVTISPKQCIALMRQLQEASGDFQATGGVHNAALCTPERIVIARADIGRHNALDKIYGYCLQRRIRTKDAIIAFSGRISSEVLLKVAKIGGGVVLSKSAPTTLALDLADDLGITAVGFIRGESMNVYSNAHRIQR
jgi:FdhD protein